MTGVQTCALPICTDANAHGFSKTQRGQLNYVKSTSASSSASSSSVRQPASSDARNFSSWKNESQPGYKRRSLGSLRINTKRKHIADDDANILSHDEQSDADDITVASTNNIIRPLPANVQPLAYNERPRSLKDEDQIGDVDEYNERVPPQAIVYEELQPIPQPSDSNPTVYIKSDDGPFFQFNHTHISERLKSHAAILRGFPLNNHIISAYHHAAMHYQVTNTGAMVKANDRTERNISIHPVNLLYYLPATDEEYQENNMG